MIEDIVFENVKYFEIEIDKCSINSYPMIIIFGSYNSTDIIHKENISIF